MAGGSMKYISKEAYIKICSLEDASKRINTFRKVAAEIFKTHGYKTSAEDWKKLCDRSPLIGDADNQHRGGALSTLLTSVSVDVIRALILGLTDVDSICAAMADTANCQQVGEKTNSVSRSKSGYAFGWPLALDVRDITAAHASVVGDVVTAVIKSPSDPKKGVAVATPAAPPAAPVAEPAKKEETKVSTEAKPMSDTRITFEDKFNAFAAVVRELGVTPQEVIVMLRNAGADTLASSLESAVSISGDLSVFGTTWNDGRKAAYDEIMRLVSEDKNDPEETADDDLLTIDETQSAIVDKMLSSLVGREVVFNDIVKSANQHKAEAMALRAKVSELQGALVASSSTVAVTVSGTEVVDGSTLAWTVEQKPLSKVFPVNDELAGSPFVKGLVDRLVVPTLVWHDAEGKEVRHPDCPPVDDGYLFRTSPILAAQKCVAQHGPLYLYGDTGSGKTEFVKQMAARTGFPFYRVNLDSEVSRIDLVGRDVIKDGASHFVDGPLPRAIGMPCFLCFDEMDFARPDLLYVVQSVLESECLRIAEDGNRIIKVHPLCNIVATGNTKGQGDERRIYSGARILSAATMNRFKALEHIDYLPAATEAAMLVKRTGISKKFAGAIAQFAHELRVAFKADQIMLAISPRNTLTMARDYVTYSSGADDADTRKEAMRLAVKYSILNFASEEDEPKISEIAQRVLAIR